MAQTNQLIEALKQALKAHGKTYVDVGLHLGLSEASVKRLFYQKSFSLQRLDQVCQMMDIEISDLVQQMNESGTGAISRLTLQQEQELVGDPELLLITVCVLNRWTLEQMLEDLDIPEPRCIKHLVRLDRLEMIELLPRNRVKLRVAPNFQWHENSPIQQFFLQKLQSDFFNSRFDQEQERLIVINGMLAASSQRGLPTQDGTPGPGIR